MTGTCRPSNRSIVVVATKHRNGPTGEVRLNFFSDYTRFDNRIETAGVDE